MWAIVCRVFERNPCGRSRRLAISVYPSVWRSARNKKGQVRIALV